MLRFLLFTGSFLILSQTGAFALTCSQEIGRGVASWYGPGFEGALTKSEDVFNPAQFSAAHQSLPFGTIVKVFNLRNGRDVIVKINDRGAFGKNRVIDLSEAAASEIGMINDGVTAVSLYRCQP